MGFNHLCLTTQINVEGDKSDPRQNRNEESGQSMKRLIPFFSRKTVERPNKRKKEKKF